MKGNQISAVGKLKTRFLSLNSALRLIVIGSVTLILLCIVAIVFLAVYFRPQGSTMTGNAVTSGGQSQVGSVAGGTFLENPSQASSGSNSSETLDHNVNSSNIGSSAENSTAVSSDESISSTGGSVSSTNGSTNSTDHTSSTESASSPPLLAEGIAVSVNVRHYGAVGDGVADDTAAFRTALSIARNQQLPVYVPAGTYRLTDYINLESQTITGYGVTDWPADQNKLPTLLLDHTNTGFVTSNAAISGVHITYKNASGSKPAIEVRATGTRISNVKITNAPSGIIFREEGPSGNPGRSNIENVIMEGINNIGLYMSGTLDVPYVCNVSVSGSSDNFKKNGKAFILCQNDDARVIGCTAKNAYIGYQFTDLPTTVEGSGLTRSTWGSLIDCTTENVEIGIDVISNIPEYVMQPLTLNRMTVKAKTNAVRVGNCRMQMTVTDCKLISSSGPAVLLEGGHGLVFFGCELQSGGSSEAIRIRKTGNTIISKCEISAGGKGIVIDNAAHTGLVIVDNTITASGTKIEDNSSSGVVKTITGNS